MPRQTGTYRTTTTAGEPVKAFVPHPLPPAKPPLDVTGKIDPRCATAMTALARLEVAANMVPSTNWFLYGFVRKEAVLTSQIEGTQATLRDVLTFEATDEAEHPEDVEEVCNYVRALTNARRELAKAKGLPLSTRLLCEAHKRLMKGVRGGDKRPGAIRKSQNWVGGTRPGNARFVPPPPEDVPTALNDLERWIHSDDPLPPLIKERHEGKSSNSHQGQSAKNRRESPALVLWRSAADGRASDVRRARAAGRVFAARHRRVMAFDQRAVTS